MTDSEEPSNATPAPPSGGRIRPWSAKFADTFRGLRLVVSEQSFRVHLVFAVAVAAVTLALGATRSEWLFLATAIGIVLITETLNTAIERLARAVTGDHHPLVGQALDISSAAVLTASLFAVIVGMVILGPKLWILILGG